METDLRPEVVDSLGMLCRGIEFCRIAGYTAWGVENEVCVKTEFVI